MIQSCLLILQLTNYWSFFIELLIYLLPLLKGVKLKGRSIKKFFFVDKISI